MQHVFNSTPVNLAAAIVAFSANWSTAERMAEGLPPDLVEVKAVASGQVVYAETQMAVNNAKRARVIAEMKSRAEDAVKTLESTLPVYNAASPKANKGAVKFTQTVVKPRDRVCGPLSNNAEIAASMIRVAAQKAVPVADLFASYVSEHGLKEGRANGVKTKLAELAVLV